MVDLVLKDVAREFVRGERIRALDGVSVIIPQGQFVAIVGESGGGKSTLLNILGMLDQPSAGSYAVGGRESTHLSRSEYAHLRGQTFSYVFQSFHLLERRDALANVELPLLYRGVDARERRERARAALETVRMERFSRTPTHLLSGGQRQRVAIARALAAQAPVLLADEPTGSLDSENTREVIASLQAVHASGVTVILVTHSEEVAASAERRLKVSDGKIIADTLSEANIHPSLTVDGSPFRKPSVLSMARDSVANAVSRPGRTGAMLASIALSIGLLLSTLGLSYSARSQVAETFDAQASSEVTVEWDTQPNEPPLDLRKVADLHGVASSAHVRVTDSVGVTARPQSRPLDVPLSRVSGDVVNAARLSVAWTPGVATLEDGTVLIGEALADQLDLAALQLVPNVLIQGVSYEVAGIIRNSPREADWIGGVIVADADGSIDTTSITERVLIVAELGAAVQVSNEVALAIDPYVPERLRVTHPTDPASARAEVESSVHAAMIVLTTVAMIAAIAAILLTAVSAANERRAEFALRRALGARPRSIWFMLAVEATVPGILGGIGGVYAGMVTILAVTLTRHWTPVFDMTTAAISLLIGVVLALCGAVAGAIRALRMVPADALRT